MESLVEVNTAQLVLGYLKVQKCKTAYKEFLKTSSALRNLQEKTGGRRYIPTRFLGLTLQEMVTEHSEISQLIQGRLENTNYYNEHRSKSLKLSEQLLYLLTTKVPSSRASTPSISYYGSQIDYMSPAHIDVETTPVDTLPGNSDHDHTFVESPRRKKVLNGRSRSSSEDSPNGKRGVDIIDTATLAQNLMDNTVFQEKIAQTINKVVEKQKKTTEADELNQTVKSAVEVAEADPLFDELLREILDTTNNAGHNSKVSEPTSSGISTKKKDATDTNANAKEVEERIADEQPISEPNNPPTQIPDNSQMNIPQMNDNPQMPIVTFNNPVDGYLITNQTSAASVASCMTNPMYINTLSGAYILPTITPTIRILSNTTIPPVITPPVITPPVLTEPDIMSMPIIIDNKSPKKEQGRKKVKVLLPQRDPTGIQDYFKNYNPADPGICQTDPPTNMPTISNPTERPGLKRVMYPITSRKSSKKADTIPKENVEHTHKSNVDPGSNNVENSAQDVGEVTNSPEKINTPVPREPLKKSTPKSASHVRNLDFSSPPVTNKQRPSSPSKSVPSQKTQATKDLFKTTETSEKGQAAKDLCPTTETAQKKQTLKDNLKPTKSKTDTQTWDSALRATVPEKLDKTPVRRGRRKGKKVVKKAKLNSTTEEEALQLEQAIKTPVKKTGETEILEENNENELETIENQNILNTQVKTILSPSKLNNTTKNILEPNKTDVTKYVTPENNKPTTSWPIKANRNIMPMLETPVKVSLPTTPGISTPLDINFSVMSSTSTPFTKMLEANLDMKGLDIGSIPTPLPITPGMPPFTPSMDLCSPYSNRPTDYSTGSSYYQPSDNEQNKNLEAHLREMEKASTQETAKPLDHLQMFNKNVIGKKNLSLMKKNFDSDSSTNSTRTEDDAEKTSVSDSDCDDTVIFKKAVSTVSPTKRYSLRSRASVDKSISPKKTPVRKKTAKTPVKKEKKTVSKGKKIANTGQDLETATKVEEVKTVLHELKPGTAMKGMTTSQTSVLEDLARKRQRVADSLKPKVEPLKTKKPPTSKFKIKPIDYTSKTQRKNESPRKRKKMKELRTVLSDLITSDDSDFNLQLSSSDDEKEIPKENKNLNIDKADNTASDVEAQNLIKGLKERGIHLMKNKSPIKKNVDGEDKEFVNTSAAHLDTVDRDSFDVKKSESFSVIHMVHDEDYKPKSNQVMSQNEHKVEYIGRLYLESIGAEVNVHLKQTELCTLFEMDPKTVSTNTTKRDIDSGLKSESNNPANKEQMIDVKVLPKNTVNKNTNINENSQILTIDPMTVCETVLTEKSSKPKKKVVKELTNKKELNKRNSTETKETDVDSKTKVVDSKKITEKVTKQGSGSNREVISIERNDDTPKKIVQKKSDEIDSSKTKATNLEKPHTHPADAKSSTQKNVVDEINEINEYLKMSKNKPAKEKSIHASNSDKDSLKIQEDTKKRKRYFDDPDEIVKEVISKRRCSVETKEIVKVVKSSNLKDEKITKSTEEKQSVDVVNEKKMRVEKRSKDAPELDSKHVKQNSKEKGTDNVANATEGRKTTEKNQPDKQSLKTNPETETQSEETSEVVEKKTKRKAEDKLVNKAKHAKRLVQQKLNIPRVAKSKSDEDLKVKINLDNIDIKIKSKVEDKAGTSGNISNRKDSTCDTSVNDDLMNFAATGKDDDATTSSERNTKTRKLFHEDLTQNPHETLIKRVDIDTFLNSIHNPTHKKTHNT
ncbi:uncharacterized protein LOC114341356 [Diabrotica virgifera virgifera]|uniref:LisH domain-containing protein n=1 Tax=Diabrotica virgifera virgifera TaxID=50390 RepID=A0ABM5KEW0_DIAVI|nr:uncharacterized protein LOC114341356 [Diabrotica virgifera virgifera]